MRGDGAFLLLTTARFSRGIVTTALPSLLDGLGVADMVWRPLPRLSVALRDFSFLREKRRISSLRFDNESVTARRISIIYAVMSLVLTSSHCFYYFPCEIESD